MLNHEQMYDILTQELSNYDGQFFTAVKTTGIYCLPSCYGKKPAKENVEFFYNVHEVELAGYRPCKKCFPNLLEVGWQDNKSTVEVLPPKEFSFEECLVYLNRSDQECLHKVRDSEVYKVIKIEDYKLLLKIGKSGSNLRVEFLNGIPPKWVRAQTAKFVWDLFDLGTDLTPFYEKAKDDAIIQLLTDKYKGLRIIKIEDLFEVISWAIIGQQINLKFAYTLKKRMVEKYGENLKYDGEEYFLFPTPQVIAQLTVDDLKELQFSSRKAEYVIGIAQLINRGVIKKEELALKKDYEKLKNKLTSIRGIGNWTADYVIMKCFDLYSAFPIADVGIHNALKGILGLNKKPTIQEIEQLALNWKGWEAYVAFYLWRWLYD
jgi:DNA-3-methyladenine glycosylase II